MKKTFNDILSLFKNSEELEIGNQTFQNEIIFDRDLSMSVFSDLKFENFNFSNVNFSGSYFTDCKFENCIFDETILRKCQFLDSIFNNCNVINSSWDKAEFDNTIFLYSQFKRVGLGWSCWLDCMLKKTNFDDVNFEGAVISNLKIKDLTVSNLNFTHTFPTKFYKSNSNEFIEVKSHSDFQKILKDFDLIQD